MAATQRMYGAIDSHGEIETYRQTSETPASSRRTGAGFDSVRPGEPVALVFRTRDDPTPPFSIVVRSPTGATIVDRVIRELPTGDAQSGAPVEFIPSVAGTYSIEIRELKGSQRGRATLRVE